MQGDRYGYAVRQVCDVTGADAVLVQVSNTADLQRWGLCIVDRSRVRLQGIIDRGLG